MYTLKSFEEKINNNFPEEKIKVLEFNGVKNPIKFYCEKCKNETYLKKAETLLSKGRTRICTKCEGKNNMKDKITKEYDNKISYILSKNDNLEVIIPFNRVSIDMIFKCKKCGNTFKRKPNVFLKTQKCPFCESRKTLKTNSIFLDDLYKRYGNEYIPLEEYQGAYKKIKVKHSCGFIYYTSPHNILNGKQCPRCSKAISKGEKQILNFLESNEIQYLFQYQVEYKGHLFKFDFYLPNDNILIEYQGIQHYEPVSFFGGEERFLKQQEYDKLKENYCLENNIKLLTISYKDFENIQHILKTLWLNDYSLQKQA